MALPIWAMYTIAGVSAAAVTGAVGVGSYFGGRRVGIKMGAKNQYIMLADGSLYTVDEYDKKRSEYANAIAHGQVVAPLSPIIPEQAHMIPRLNALHATPQQQAQPLDVNALVAQVAQAVAGMQAAPPQAQPRKAELIAAVAAIQGEIAALTAALQPTA